MARPHLAACALFVAIAVGGGCAGSPTSVDSARARPGHAEAASRPDATPASALAAAPAAPDACAPSVSRVVDVASGRAGQSIALVESEGRRLALIADEDHGVVRTIDANALRELAVTRVDGKPAQLLPLRDGRIVVTLRDKAAIAVLELPKRPELPLLTRCTRPTFAEPFGLAVSRDGTQLAATAGWGHRLMLFAVAPSFEMSHSVDLPPEPRGVRFAGDGRTAYVAHLIGGVVSAVDLATRQVTAIPVRPLREPAGSTKKAPPGRTPTSAESARTKPPADPKLAASHGYSVLEIAIGKTDDAAWPARLFVPMASSDPMQFGAVSSFPSRYGGGGGTAVIGAFVAVVDPIAKGALGGETRPLFRARPEDCILPRGAATSSTRIYITCLGTHDVVVLDGRSVDPVSAEIARYRVGEGPTGIVIDEVRRRALVFSQFSVELSIIDLEAQSGAVVQALPLSRPKTPVLDEQAALGRTLFHATRDIRLSMDGRACASCHPDGRADGLTWATPDGPRQTIFLAGRVADDPPFGWFGDHSTMKQHVRFAAKRLGGTGLDGGAEDERDLAALLAYLRTLAPPARTSTLDGPEQIAARARGREIFDSAATGCATCHPGGGTDHTKHDVGSGSAAETTMRFDTPSLRRVGGAAPYFHDGRYPSLDALVADPKSRMGHASALSSDDRKALVAYLESL